MAIVNKVALVPDSVCRECSQCWENECRAFSMAHSQAEFKHRSDGRMACNDRQEVSDGFQQVVG